MANHCKQYCVDYPPIKKLVGQSEYLLGNKYCARCMTFMFVDGWLCPCCGNNLRGRAKWYRSKRDVFEGY